MPKKIEIFLLYFLMTVKSSFFHLFVKNRKPEQAFLGMIVSGFDYETMRYLFGEIFVRSEYYFHSQNSSPVIFDCGANIGMATLFFKWLYPHSKIYSFEPDPATFDMLKENISRNKLENVFAFNYAISDAHEKIDFFIHEAGNGSLKMSAFPERLSGRKIEVQGVPLSAFIQENRVASIDFIKMDIEGSENKSLREMNERGVLLNVKKMAIEYHHNIKDRKASLSEIISILEKNAFKYQIDAHNTPIHLENSFQDVLLYCYKP